MNDEGSDTEESVADKLEVVSCAAGDSDDGDYSDVMSDHDEKTDSIDANCADDSPKIEPLPQE